MSDAEKLSAINTLLDYWNPDADDDTYYLVREVEKILGRVPR